MAMNQPPYGAQTLESHLVQRGPLAPQEVLPLFGPVMDQLSAMHSAGQRHGNVSPDTITVAPTADGTMTTVLSAPTALPPGAWPFFQAPEQLVAGGQVGYWTDIYALGAVIYRALARQPPFAGASLEAVRAGHLQAPQPSICMLRPDLSPGLDGVLRQTLAKSPAERPPSVPALRQVLEAAVMAAPQPQAQYLVPPYAAAPPPATHVHPINAPSGGGRKPVVAIGVILSLVIAIGAAVAVFFASGTDGDRSSSSSTSKAAQTAESSKPRPAPPQAPSRAPEPKDKPVAVGVALPGVDDKIQPAPTPSANAHVDATTVRVDVRGSPYKGANDAPVVIVMWGDFQCPWCKRLAPVLDSVVRKYPRDVKVVWMDFPLRFHKQALPAAIAAREVFQQRGNAAFWKLHDKIYADYRNLSRDTLVRWAQNVGARGSEVGAALDAQRRKGDIDRQQRSGQDVGVRGTPTIHVNGRVYKGRRDLDSFSTWIDEELIKAKGAIASGAATRATYYDTIQRSASTRVLPKRRSPSAKKDPTRPKRRRLKKDALYNVPVSDREPWLGAKRPLVTIVMFSDFECPYCRYLACVMKILAKNNKRTVRLHFRHFPLSFHKRAMPAAEATEAAFDQKGRRGFWKMYERLFALQGCTERTVKLGASAYLREVRSPQGWLDGSALESYARKIGLRQTKFRAALESHRYRANVERQITAGKLLGVYGTPASFLNGRYVRGAVQYDLMKTILAEEVRKALKLVRSGISRRKLYSTIIAKGAPRATYDD
ncbi:MAG: thioredoxin domain-containing protein [bacterium]